MTRALGPPFTDAERVAFVAAARSYIGVRWKHQGRSRRGLDCGGLLIVSAFGAGRLTADAQAGYGREPYRHSLEDVLRENLGDPVDAEPTVGDVVMFHVGRAAPNHVGIVGDYVHGGLSIIHAYAITGQVVESPFDASWRNLLSEVYRP